MGTGSPTGTGCVVHGGLAAGQVPRAAETGYFPSLSFLQRHHDFN